MSDALSQKLQSALSLCRKAGALHLGFDAVCDCLKSDKAQLLLLTSDVAENTRRRLLRHVPDGLEVVELACNKDALAPLLNKPVAVLCVSDINLARLCLSKI